MKGGYARPAEIKFSEQDLLDKRLISRLLRKHHIDFIPMNNARQEYKAVVRIKAPGSPSKPDPQALLQDESVVANVNKLLNLMSSPPDTRRTNFDSTTTPEKNIRIASPQQLSVERTTMISISPTKKPASREMNKTPPKKSNPVVYRPLFTDSDSPVINKVAPAKLSKVGSTIRSTTPQTIRTYSPTPISKSTKAGNNYANNLKQNTKSHAHLTPRMVPSTKTPVVKKEVKSEIKRSISHAQGVRKSPPKEPLKAVMEERAVWKNLIKETSEFSSRIDQLCNYIEQKRATMRGIHKDDPIREHINYAIIQPSDVDKLRALEEIDANCSSISGCSSDNEHVASLTKSKTLAGPGIVKRKWNQIHEKRRDNSPEGLFKKGFLTSREDLSKINEPETSKLKKSFSIGSLLVFLDEKNKEKRQEDGSLSLNFSQEPKLEALKNLFSPKDILDLQFPSTPTNDKLKSSKKLRK